MQQQRARSGRRKNTSEKELNAGRGGQTGRGTRGVRSYSAASGQTRWGLKRPSDEATGHGEHVPEQGMRGPCRTASQSLSVRKEDAREANGGLRGYCCCFLFSLSDERARSLESGPVQEQILGGPGGAEGLKREGKRREAESRPPGLPSLHGRPDQG